MATSSIAARPPLVDSKAPASELDYRPSYLAASIAGAAILLLYLITLSPSTAMWDASEYIAAAFTLGLPHPPGNPLFVLIGRVFSLLPIGPNVAIRINVLAAVCSALSAMMWFLITERVLVSWLPARWQRILAGSLAVLIGGTAFTVWNQSVVNEKVYTVSLLGIAIVSWLMIRWSDDPDGWKADRILVLVAYILGLGYANHMAGLLAAPAVGLAVIVRRPRMLLRWKLLLACAAALFFGMTPFATQPIRAAHNPPINEGEPTACREGLGFSCTFSWATYDAFMYNLNRGQYGKPNLAERQAPFTAQVGMWWHYFRWQWLRDAHLENQIAQNVLGAVFLVLGLFGGWVHYQRDRRSFWYFGSLMFTMSLLLIYYLNFKYGASQSPELGDTVNREVRDRDYFFLWSFSAWGVWAALGLVFTWESIASLVGTHEVRYGRMTLTLPSRKGLIAGAPILALGLVPLFTNWSTASRRGQTYTRDFAHDLLNSVEPYGVLVTVGDNDTFPLWYAQEVEGIRKDVIVANTSLLNTDWYTRQLIRREVFTYDAAKGPAIYRDKQWVKPAGPPLRMTLGEADSVPPYIAINKPMLFTSSGCQADSTKSAPSCVKAVIDPRGLPPDGAGNGILQRADIFVLRMIQDAYPTRPIYFARTSGNYARELGFGDYVLTQGLASKLFSPSRSAVTKDTMYIAGDGWLDVPRTKTLWNEVFLGADAVVRANDWVDRPSVGIPYLYIATGMELAAALREQGQVAEANKVTEKARNVAQAVRLQNLFAQSLAPIQESPLLTPPGDSIRGTPLPATKK
jgi:hypothetical protein